MPGNFFTKNKKMLIKYKVLQKEYCQIKFLNVNFVHQVKTEK